ncbi:hypothetical protein [Dokdonia sp.]|uniref:hypothetical protein n=1 Tax=Dokdonia sp. TaxID=2024995 RepID=UPI003263A549
MERKKKDKKIKIDLSNVPVDSSLGLLAVGDIAFVEWRKVKKAHNIVKGVKVIENNTDE